MKPLGVKFPTEAEAALRNAGEYRGLSAQERLECLLSLIRTAEAISRGRPNRADQVAQHDRMKDEEFKVLIRTQVRGHV